MLDNLIKLDIKYLNIFRGFIDVNSPIQVKLIMFLADFQVIFVAILLVLIWLKGTYKNNDSYKKESLQIFYTIGFAFIVYIILNQFLPVRPRPEDFTTIRPLVDHLPDNSFPSGHAIFAGASIIAFFKYCKKELLSWLVLIFAVLMLPSRIISGVHFPGDILVGLIIGLILGIIGYKIQKGHFFDKYLINLLIKLVSYIKL